VVGRFFRSSRNDISTNPLTASTVLTSQWLTIIVVTVELAKQHRPTPTPFSLFFLSTT
jgi:hypothetical protein